MVLLHTLSGEIKNFLKGQEKMTNNEEEKKKQTTELFTRDQDIMVNR